MNPFQSIANYLDNDLYRWEDDEERKRRYYEMYPDGDANLGDWDFLERARVRRNPASGYQQWDERSADADSGKELEKTTTVVDRDGNEKVTQSFRKSPVRQSPYPDPPALSSRPIPSFDTAPRGIDLGQYARSPVATQSVPPTTYDEHMAGARPSPAGRIEAYRKSITPDRGTLEHLSQLVGQSFPGAKSTENVNQFYKGVYDHPVSQLAVGAGKVIAKPFQAISDWSAKRDLVTPATDAAGRIMDSVFPPAGASSDIPLQQFNQTRATAPRPPVPVQPNLGPRITQGGRTGPEPSRLNVPTGGAQYGDSAYRSWALPELPSSEDEGWSPDSIINDFTRMASSPEPITNDIYTDAVIDFVGRDAERDEMGMKDWYSQMAREAIKKFNGVTPVYKKKKKSFVGPRRPTKRKGK